MFLSTCSRCCFSISSRAFHRDAYSNSNVPGWAKRGGCSLSLSLHFKRYRNVCLKGKTTKLTRTTVYWALTMFMALYQAGTLHKLPHGNIVMQVLTSQSLKNGPRMPNLEVMKPGFKPKQSDAITYTPLIITSKKDFLVFIQQTISHSAVFNIWIKCALS